MSKPVTEVIQPEYTRRVQIITCPWQGRGYRRAVLLYADGRYIRTDYGLWYATRAEAQQSYRDEAS